MLSLSCKTDPTQFGPEITTMDELRPNKLLSREEAARFLGVKKGTLEVWASTGRYELPVVKIGRLAKYRLSDLMDFIEARTVCAGAPREACRR